MVIGTHRPTKLVIDRQAIKTNIRQEMKRLNDDTEIWAVVKANGYGHGMVEVATVAQAAGATGFCVAILDEALALRAAGFTEPILVLGITEPQAAELAASQQISLTVGSLAWLETAATELHQTVLQVHFALDTGMGRIGFQTPAQLQAAEAYITEHSKFNLAGIFTHFATADEADTAYFEGQVKKFNTLMASLKERPHYVHVSNSATSLWHAACNGNVIRFGVAMYGLNPSGGELRPPYSLQPALRLESTLNFVKQVHAGDGISYGATYKATKDEWIGTIPIGYADGWPRRMQGFHVLINGEYCEIVGRVCMDQLMVRLPKELAVGTKVTLVGQNGLHAITLQDVATYAETIHYEIACGFATRVPRTYQN
ncbi:alanine racemase [Loigolactobacillus backii]|uniref:Alanine racemase n=1 Tax=Loigolactobacillus backii TaxID=375175 RepID=A0A192H0K4_9LACO|nr:alanine racemase [Loigolactobacillus backii]ANK62324.1 alanine racemase [Loigolactobacillus backii]ANK70663.1 alanine racemase [Loigolactobacillus backii]MDA5387926.1 alanine racemase [Loigolactobacillus backii]MDA5390437.1 alanine racemase [Loigolactobacillus backii]PIO82752.1 alanine racemase [Loigolactobacillus backii]